jgi:hypothetical protein
MRPPSDASESWLTNNPGRLFLARPGNALRRNKSAAIRGLADVIGLRRARELLTHFCLRMALLVAAQQIASSACLEHQGVIR